MRAIIGSASAVSRDDLEAHLRLVGWWPSLSQDDAEILTHRDDILQHVSQADQTLTARTLLCTIYDEETRSWGIVSNPATGQVTIRLKNASSERLKHACEKIIQQLGALDASPFKFGPRIEVLEPNSEHHAFSGQIVPPQRLWHAILDRKREAWVGSFAYSLAGLLLFVTSPTGAQWFLAGIAPSWRLWVSGNLERFSTAALVTGTLLWFEVGLHWLELRRQPVIRWDFE